MAAFESHRYFQVWSLTPSHSTLMLRSEPSWMDESTTRIEIYASHVEALMIKPRMQGLRIARAVGAEHDDACRRFRVEAEPGTLYLLETDGFAGFLISGTPQWREAVRELGDPTLFDFAAALSDAEAGRPAGLPQDVTAANID